MFQTKKAAPFTAAYPRGANTHVAGEQFQSTICSPGREFATLVKNLIAVGVITAAFVGIAVEATTPKPRKPAQQVSDQLANAPTKQRDRVLDQNLYQARQSVGSQKTRKVRVEPNLKAEAEQSVAVLDRHDM